MKAILTLVSFLAAGFSLSAQSLSPGAALLFKGVSSRLITSFDWLGASTAVNAC